MVQVSWSDLRVLRSECAAPTQRGRKLSHGGRADRATAPTHPTPKGRWRERGLGCPWEKANQSQTTRGRHRRHLAPASMLTDGGRCRPPKTAAPLAKGVPDLGGHRVGWSRIRVPCARPMKQRCPPHEPSKSEWRDNGGERLPSPDGRQPRPFHKDCPPDFQDKNVPIEGQHTPLGA